MKKIVLVFFLLVLQCLAHSTVYCKIKGKVVDAETGQGIPDVNVKLNRYEPGIPGGTFLVMTDKDGKFTFSNLEPGNFCLNYYPLFPYAAFPYRKNDGNMSSGKYNFTVKEGEIKYVEQKLLIGGEFIFHVDLPSGYIEEQYEEVYLKLHFVRGEGIESGLNRVGVRHFSINPKFEPAPEGRKVSGLRTGDYLVSIQLEKISNITTESEDFVGVLTPFTLKKRESKHSYLRYNSTSRLLLDIVGANGDSYHSATIEIFRKYQFNAKNVSNFLVFRKNYDKSESIRPLIIEPGNYYIRTSGFLINGSGEKRYYGISEFPVQIIEGRSIEKTLRVTDEGNWGSK